MDELYRQMLLDAIEATQFENIKLDRQNNILLTVNGKTLVIPQKATYSRFLSYSQSNLVYNEWVTRITHYIVGLEQQWHNIRY